MHFKNAAEHLSIYSTDAKACKCFLIWGSFFGAKNAFKTSFTHHRPLLVTNAFLFKYFTIVEKR